MSKDGTLNAQEETESTIEIYYPQYIIYNISPSNIPVFSKDKSGGSETYLELLNYGGNRYATMLPLT